MNLFKTKRQLKCEIKGLEREKKWITRDLNLDIREAELVIKEKDYTYILDLHRKILSLEEENKHYKHILENSNLPSDYDPEKIYKVELKEFNR